MVRGLSLLLGVIAYLFFFFTFLYLIGCAGNLSLVPHTADRGSVPQFAPALAINAD